MGSHQLKSAFPTSNTCGPNTGNWPGCVSSSNSKSSAYRQIGYGQIAPAQRLADFVAGKASGSLPRCSYVPGIAATRMEQWMPGTISDALRGGLASFGKKLRGFVTNEALVVGVESRTSSPVRIPRDPATLMHPQTAGLLAGEGAGYAGGIISAAIDGERCADRAADYLAGKPILL